MIRDAAAPAAFEVVETFHALPVAFGPTAVSTIERAEAACGYKHMRMPPGAFYDAQFAASFCPTGMIFVPCREGISHKPAEYSSPAQLKAGTRILARALTELAGQ